MSKFLFLRSSDSVEYFPLNKNSDFQVKLESPLSLDTFWYISLREIRFKLKPKQSTKSLIIYCDLCQPSMINGTSAPVLRRLSRQISQEFACNQFFPIGQKYIERVHIYIRDEEGKEPSFADQPVEVTLQLKRVIHHQFL